MKVLFLLFSIVFLYSCQSEKKVKTAEETALAELQSVLEEEGGQLWNYSLLGPVMLVDRDSRQIIANESDSAGILVHNGDYFYGTLPESIIIANTAVNWGGKRWTMVALPLPETKAERLNLLIHESFHRIQPEIGFGSLNEIQNDHLNTKDGRVYLKLELEALKASLQAKDPQVHLKNALTFRQYRHQLFPDAKDAENSVEINEGIAEFTGSILSQRTTAELKKHYRNKIEQLYSFPTFVRSFPYYTIPVYGFFMQKIDVDWNKQVTNTTDLTDFIAAYFHANDTTPLQVEQIASIGKIYGLDSIVAFETDREEQKLQQIISYKKVFLSDSILDIPLIDRKIGFNPANLVPLDSIGTVFPTIKATDTWGVLTVDSCGALMSPDWMDLRLSYPMQITDTLISGKGWTLKLNKSWKAEKQGTGYILTKL